MTTLTSNPSPAIVSQYDNTLMWLKKRYIILKQLPPVLSLLRWKKNRIIRRNCFLNSFIKTVFFIEIKKILLTSGRFLKQEVNSQSCGSMLCNMGPGVAAGELSTYIPIKGDAL